MAAPTQQQIKQAFDAFDTDKSGQISCQELYQVLQQCGVKVNQDQCAQLIKMFDADKSGQMEFPEFQKLINEALKHKTA
jgi:Ca2+-binding EF-hand superfamily protein